METYAICGEHVLFAVTSDNLNQDSKSITLSTETVLECAKVIKQIGIDSKKPTTGIYLCPNCNNFGFPSIYTLVEPDQRTGLCTDCANKLRLNERFIVDGMTMEIRLKPPTPKVVCDQEEIFQKVIQAETELKAIKKERSWHLRACRAGICPECGTEISPHNDKDLYTEYKCSKCSFSIWEDVNK